jgi:putative proteasome-type protease
LVLLSDTRTNAGVDNISVFGKTYVTEVPGDRVLALLCSGNLAISQTVWNRLQEGVLLDGRRQTLRDVPSMFHAAELVGAAVREVYRWDGPSLSAQGLGFDVAVLLGGQIAGEAQRLFMVYSAGNFIEATPDTPFLQLGEHKYGKPMLDRAVSYETPLPDGVKLVLVSMDSTLRSNLTVGLPLDLLVYRADSLAVTLQRRITEDDPYFGFVRQHWGAALREAYLQMAAPDWFGA